MHVRGLILINKKNILIMLCILLSVLVTSFVLASESYSITDDLMSWDSSNWFTFASGETDSLLKESIDLGWYALTENEINYCSQDLTSSFETSTNSYDGVTAVDTVYDLTIAMNPLIVDEGYMGESGSKQYLVKLGWYLQGLEDDKVTYSVRVIPFEGTIDSIDLGEGKIEKEFTLSTGTSGFYSDYTSKCYNKVELIVDGQRKKVYDFVCQDVNGEHVSCQNLCN
jgi:hypothetical protein